jgi:hypothetical protein
MCSSIKRKACFTGIFICIQNQPELVYGFTPVIVKHPIAFVNYSRPEGYVKTRKLHAFHHTGKEADSAFESGVRPMIPYGLTEDEAKLCFV